MSTDDIFPPGITRQRLEKAILPPYMGAARWFGGKAKAPQKFTIVSEQVLAKARLLLVRVEYANAAAETYLVPLQASSGQVAKSLIEQHPKAIAAHLGEGEILFDAIHDEAFRAALFTLVLEGGSPAGAAEIVGVPGHVPSGITNTLPSRVLGAEQSNSAVVYGDQVFLKLYRRIEEGVNPDAEILRFLSDHGFTQSPSFYGALEFQSEDGARHVLGLAVGMIPNKGDAWEFTLAELSKFYERALAAAFDAMPFARLSHTDTSALPKQVANVIGEDFLARVRQLGARTGEMHRTLASDESDPEFQPENFTENDRLVLATAISDEGKRVLGILAERRERFPAELHDAIATLLKAAPRVSEAATRLAALSDLAAAKTRTHGDYHLGQVLNTGDDFVILDFEGEPARTLAERRLKRSPLRDVAGMLRSFHYAAHSAASSSGAGRDQTAPLAEMWAAAASRTFLQAWLSTVQGAKFVPSDSKHLAQLLEAFLLEKALYEITYEMNNRPDWIGIPLRGILSLLCEG